MKNQKDRIVLAIGMHAGSVFEAETIGTRVTNRGHLMRIIAGALSGKLGSGYAIAENASEYRGSLLVLDPGLVKDSILCAFGSRQDEYLDESVVVYNRPYLLREHAAPLRGCAVYFKTKEAYLKYYREYQPEMCDLPHVHRELRNLERSNATHVITEIFAFPKLPAHGLTHSNCALGETVFRNILKDQTGEDSGLVKEIEYALESGYDFLYEVQEATQWLCGYLGGDPAAKLCQLSWKARFNRSFQADYMEVAD